MTMKTMSKSKEIKSMKYLLGPVAIAILSLPLSGCNLYEPGTINENRIQVREQAFSQSVALPKADSEFIAALARHYSKHGSSSLELAIIYDPKSSQNTAMMATNSAGNLVTSLRDYGVMDINASILPVNGHGDEARVLVSYDALTAHAPKNCGILPGLNNSAFKSDMDYKLGCSIDTMLAKQISKPRDLMGRGQSDMTTDGRGLANIVEGYRTGAQNEPLDGELASGE